MPTDVLILNTAALDIRSRDFAFTEGLVGPGGLAKCRTEDMPAYTQAEIRRWVEEGAATAGGPGNTAPLIARAGLNVAVGVNLGGGECGGLDVQGRAFHDVMTAGGVDMSETFVHPELPTGTTFIHDAGDDERGGIAYFPNANNDFDFERFKGSVERLRPRVVYYMYSGLSDRGDANEGADLAEFIGWCRGMGSITIADSHTLAGDPEERIRTGAPVEAYRLLVPLLPELDIFFTSAAEARMIENTLGEPRGRGGFDEENSNRRFLDFVTGRFWREEARTRVCGVTYSRGAFEKHVRPDGTVAGPDRIESRFMAGEIIDLVGAGDSFRAGLIAHVARNESAFRDGTLDFSEAVQMGNLFASLYIKAPLDDRYGNIRPYEAMLRVVRRDDAYASVRELIDALSHER